MTVLTLLHYTFCLRAAVLGEVGRPRCLLPWRVRIQHYALLQRALSTLSRGWRASAEMVAAGRKKIAQWRRGVHLLFFRRVAFGVTGVREVEKAPLLGGSPPAPLQPGRSVLVPGTVWWALSASQPAAGSWGTKYKYSKVHCN